MGESGRMSANLGPSEIACMTSSSVVRRSQNHLATQKQNQMIIDSLGNQVANSSLMAGNKVAANKHSSLMQPFLPPPPPQTAEVQVKQTSINPGQGDIHSSIQAMLHGPPAQYLNSNIQQQYFSN